MALLVSFDEDFIKVHLLAVGLNINFPIASFVTAYTNYKSAFAKGVDDFLDAS